MVNPKLIPSKTKVNHAGDLLIDYVFNKNRKISNDDLWEAYVLLSNWRAIHSYPINTFQATLRNKLKKIEPNSLVAQRLKRIPSIIKKLNRFENMQLTRMQDIGGLRAVVTNLNKVRELEQNYRSSRFQHTLHTSKEFGEV